MNIKEIFDNGILPFYLFLFQIAFTIFLGVFGDYNIGNVKSNATEVPEIYASNKSNIFTINCVSYINKNSYFSVDGCAYNDVYRFWISHDIFEKIRLR